MKKIAWICITALFIYIAAGCGRIRKTPEGLIKKDAVDNSEGSAKLNSFSTKDDAQNEKTGDSPILRQNASLYFWDRENNRLVCESQNIITADSSSFVNEIIMALIGGPQSEDLQPVMPKGTKVIGVEQIDNIVTVNLSKKFLDAEDLLVARTALVNTLTEREGIKYVKINIDGQELTSGGTEGGQPLGVLSRTTNNINELIATQDHEASEDNVKEVNRELFFRDFRGRYLLSEVRPINVKNGGIARAIVEELIKGPVKTSQGLYPVMPQGTQLLDINLLDGKDEDSKIVALYFSKELKAPFIDQGTSRGDNKKEDPKELQDKADQIRNRETIILSSIVYNLSGLNNIEGVKVFYQNKYGVYIDTPLYSIDLKRPLTTKDFPDKLGRKVKIYFADSTSTNLVPDYRAMSRENVQIAKTIIDELVLGPREDTEQMGVIPSEIAKGDIKVWMDEDNTRVMVDLPANLDGNKMGSAGALMTLYAIVNSLTDPVNTQNIKEVQFLVDGKIVKTFGNFEFSEPFIRNPAIIAE